VPLPRGPRRDAQRATDLLPVGATAERGADAQLPVLVRLAGDDLTQSQQFQRLLHVQRGGDVLDPHPVVVVVGAVVGLVDDHVVASAEEVQPGHGGEEGELTLQHLRSGGHLGQSAHAGQYLRMCHRCNAS
jgi:hypothetical protein